DRQQSSHDKASDSNSPDASMPKGSANVQEGVTKVSDGSANSTDIWGRAYDSLKKNNNELVIEYEELLSKQDLTDATNGPYNDGKPMNAIEQNNPQKRKLQMDEMMKAGQSRREEKKIKYRFLGKDHVFEDDVASAVNVVLWAKD